MFHAEGKAGFELGYIEGLADGKAGVTGDRAYASGRAHIGFGESVPSWSDIQDRLNPNNYYVYESNSIPYLKYHSPGPSKEWTRRFEKFQYEEPRTFKKASPSVESNHLSPYSGSVQRNSMYGFRRRRFGVRRIYRRRPIYRRRRNY